MTHAPANAAHASHDHADHGDHQATVPHYDDLNVGAIVVSAIASTILTLVIIFAVQGFSYHLADMEAAAREQEAKEKGYKTPSEELVEKQKAYLSSATSDDGSLKISIDEAAARVLAEYK